MTLIEINLTNERQQCVETEFINKSTKIKIKYKNHQKIQETDHITQNNFGIFYFFSTM